MNQNNDICGKICLDYESMGLSFKYIIMKHTNIIKCLIISSMVVGNYFAKYSLGEEA